MRKILTVLACALALGGCATTGTGGVSDTIAKVQEATRAACAFLPTATTIASLISTGQFSGVIDIANSICAAVSTKSARRGGGRPTVKGVPINGAFVRK